MQGILYLCATPIGNLSDITFRVVETLKSVDLIAAEDTRNSIKLLNHLQIKTPMTSYHEHNKIEKADTLVNSLLQGKNIALITDAGTPAISDPGEVLVRKCQENGILVTSLPGPAACIVALTLSGLETRRFCFEGFLPTDKKTERLVLEELKGETRTIIIYESPHRVLQTLDKLRKHLGNRKITICRELTKKYESIMPTTIEEAMLHFQATAPRGEFVIVMEGKSFQEKIKEEQKTWENITIVEHMQIYLEKEMDKKEAMKKVAKDRGIPKREVYNKLLETLPDS
jgi:16S rRNA (cytidine1402-2'-O)-methyltransferase